jgi:hypothetical protein
MSMWSGREYNYEDDLKRWFIVAISDRTILNTLSDEERADFRQLRYRFRKGQVGETTMRKVVEKYLDKQFLIVNK